MFQEYVPKKIAASTLAVIEQANEIITEYQGKGLDLTLRQLYYQFVARDLIEDAVKPLIDFDTWEEGLEEETADTAKLREFAETFEG